MNHVEEIADAAAAGKLVAVIGAGASIAVASRSTPARSWPDLLRSAFSFANEAGHIDDVQLVRWQGALNSGDMDDLLGAAEFSTRKLGGKKGLLYARWLEQEFSKQKIASNSNLKSSLQSLHRLGVPIATLNYDTLLEKIVKANPITMSDLRAVLAWSRREDNSILHLHGIWSQPESIVLGVSDYNEAVADQFRANLQRGLLSFNRILFIGCGETLYDPNFSSLLGWVRDVLGSSSLQHYALVRDSEVEPKMRDPQWQGLVRPIGYGPNYSDLSDFISRHITPSKLVNIPRLKRKKPDDEVIQSYRKQIIVDCGKMTIEGVRADADTAKQKFDLERLFVPLSVAEIPPEFAPNDPDKEAKLKDWQEKHGSPLTFGEALRQNDRLALLALPGGGKTILLKRLAVAYADPARQSSASDDLPDDDLLPILIRCREWRNYIALPIATMIAKMGEITGNNALTGLFEAISDRLRTGKMILLVDGLDEIHNDADRCIFVDNLEAFLETHKKVKLVVTSREAGFALVAPSLMRFCTRWRISPLSGDAINLLCSHWHDLMGASIGNVEEETKEVVEAISHNPALQRLAENPLLLTMLLVVKHGFGRLPPDRVTLYERAVEVLLDTWNIRGHAALNPREAVPQIAYVAYRLMEQGKQTATESELLALIEECRREVPLVHLYARDSPNEFLKRVELRSSLILEAGNSPENGKLVPFYQFRHLTFQEYMAAIAVVDGHYSGFSEADLPLAPIIGRVASDEWKEVVPMAAVLAKKRASSIINELINIAEKEEATFLVKGDRDERYEWSSNYRLPASVSRLLQCLIEEAEVNRENLDKSARLVATFAHGCQGQENWSALMKGPFGSTVLDEAWRLFKAGTLPKQSWIRNTVCVLSVLRKPTEFWISNEGMEFLREQLVSQDIVTRADGAAVVCGLFWQHHPSVVSTVSIFQPLLEANVLRDEAPYNIHAIWALAMLYSRKEETDRPIAALSTASLEKMTRMWIDGTGVGSDIVPFALSSAPMLSPNDWPLRLSDKDKSFLAKAANRRMQFDSERNTAAEAVVRLRFYAGIKMRAKTVREIYEFRTLNDDEADMLMHFGLSKAEIDRSLAEADKQRRRRKELRAEKPGNRLI